MSALLFEHGRLAWIRKLWERRRITPLCSDATADELLRVLAYPKFKLDESEIVALFRSYLLYVEVVPRTEAASARAPRCRDPDDQQFLDLAFAGRAGVLVSGDGDLLAHEGKGPFAIERPSDFNRRFA